LTQETRSSNDVRWMTVESNIYIPHTHPLNIP
jgi:hypothetical protein